ncbi:MAG: DNA repair protein RecO [Lachnospiraceae bacterium]|nr:DNA repair protein RecO [Lachnospiraceae bacterium]
MTGEVTLTGMVILAAPANEYDKRVVILTRERGKITAFAKGAKRSRSQLAAGTRPFSFGEFTLYAGKTAYNLVSVRIENYFEEITGKIESVYYGSYFLEMADYFGTENVESTDMLLLLYQSLRALMKESLDNRLVRRIFELKILTINGIYPNVFECMKCGRKEELNGFSMKFHGTLCSHCQNEDKIELSTSTIYAMQYIISSGIGKLFTFSVSEEVMIELSMVLNRFMVVYVDKKFNSLELLELL